MKSLLLTMLCSCFLYISYGQTLQVGYYGHNIIDPGIKMGVQLPIIGTNHQLYTAPQLGYWNQRLGYQSFIINNDIGYRHHKELGGFYQAFSLGLGYIMELNTARSTVSVGSGEASHQTNINHLFMTTINTEVGGRLANQWGWYTKLSFGGKVPVNNNFGIVFLYELGLHYSLN